ncbi:MAG TPA: hypothetical protein VNM48_00185 [Chloroflexota bacterium]|nr:hypothetical protein [Chloroflexota bacterium]
MTATERALAKKAKALASKFYEDAQALFDSPDMTEELYAGEVMQALVMAQGYAEDSRNGGAA